MKLPKKITDIFKKTGKGAGEVAPKGTALGKAGKIAGYGGAAGLAIEGIDALTKKLQNDALNNPDKDIQVASEQDNEPIVPGGSVLPSNVIPFRVNRSLKTYNNLVPDNVPDSVKIDILEKRVGELTEKVDRFEKVEAEREQALAFHRQEDKIEQKIQKVESDHVSGKTKKVIQNVAKDVMGPAILAMLMSMGALKGFIADTTEKVEGLNTDITDILQKLALASIPGFAIADLAKKKLGPVSPLGGKPPMSAAPDPIKPRTGSVPSSPKSNVPAPTTPEPANDNKISKIREKLTRLKAPKWLFDILDKVGKLARITSSKVPFIGAMITIILETIDSYNPDLHKDPAEFQKLLIKSIVVGLGQSLAFGAIIVLFTLVGGPLGTLAGIIVYVLAEDKINDTIREELIGYLVKYVLFDEDPLEAAKKSGRYKTYENLRKDAEDKLNLAKGNLAVIENKEGRGESLTPHEQSMKEGFKAQIQGYEKRGQILKDAQKEIEIQGQKQKEYVDAGRAGARSADSANGGTGDLKGGDAIRKQVYDSFINAGFSDQQAKSLTAEVGRENSFQPNLVFGSHTDPANAAQNTGFFSWQKERSTALIADLKSKGMINPDGSLVKSQETLNAMARFAKNEMETNPAYKRTKDEFLGDKNIDPEKAAEVLGNNYIRWRYDDPVYAHHHNHRRAYYNQIDKITKDDQFKKKRLNDAVPSPADPVPVNINDFRAAEPVPSTDKKIDLLPEAPVAPRAPSVTVINEAPPPQQISPRIEQSELPAPGEIPSPTMSGRPNLNTTYSPI